MSSGVIAALDEQGGIGRNGALPWRIPEDLAFFKRITSASPGSAVIMGRRTWESIPEKFRPLSNRLNIILSSSAQTSPSAAGTLKKPVWCNDINSALKIACSTPEIFFIGGAAVYHAALSLKPDFLYITHVKNVFNCDVFFPEFSPVSGFSGYTPADTIYENTAIKIIRYIPRRVN